MEDVIAFLKAKLTDTSFDYITLTKGEVLKLIADIEEGVQQIHWNLED